jgi:hypothetical protein
MFHGEHNDKVSIKHINKNNSIKVRSQDWKGGCQKSEDV